MTINHLKSAEREIRKAMDDVTSGGRQWSASDEQKCLRVWAALNATAEFLDELESNDGCITTVVRTLTNTSTRYQRGQQVRGYPAALWLQYLMDGARYALIDISAALGALKTKRSEEQQGCHTLSTEDELTIRRAVWASFHRHGHTKCYYPTNHPYREIWADEAAAIAAEFTDEILAEAPRAEVISIEDACQHLNFQEAMRVFGELPIYEVHDGEAIPFPTEKPNTEQPEKEEPLPAAAVN